MLVVNELTGAWGIPSVSPFCLKLTTWLRMADLPYERGRNTNPFKAPKGKFPWVDDDGEIIADSGHIIARLTEKHGVALDAHLTERDRAAAHALRRLVEDSFYFALIWERWIDPSGWAYVKRDYFRSLPGPARAIVPGFARRKVRAYLDGQGMGRHSPDEIRAHGLSDLDALSTTLKERGPYFFGEPSSFDAVAFGFLAQLRWSPVASPLTERVQRDDALAGYCERMRARYWPDMKPEVG